MTAKKRNWTKVDDARLLVLKAQRKSVAAMAKGTGQNGIINYKQIRRWAAKAIPNTSSDRPVDADRCSASL
jgi:hypothetical protein